MCVGGEGAGGRCGSGGGCCMCGCRGDSPILYCYHDLKLKFVTLVKLVC